MSNIKIGDIVSVNFYCVGVTLTSRAEVVYIPKRPGDGWVFKDANTGQVHYVSEGCTISPLNY